MRSPPENHLDSSVWCTKAARGNCNRVNRYKYKGRQHKVSGAVEESSGRTGQSHVVFRLKQVLTAISCFI